MVLCDQSLDSSCADPADVDELLKSVYFNFKFMEESLDFGSVRTIGKKPVSVDESTE